MASDPKESRIEDTLEDSSTLMQTGIADDQSYMTAKKELFKLPMDEKIDFTIKSHLTDVTFIIEGKKIYAGRDFLSLLSTFFNALLKGNFAESNKEEIELNDVSYDEFHEMLRYLSEQTRVIKDEHIESQLLMADRFDIKCLIDRAENNLIESKGFSGATKYILADRYRLIKLAILCCDWTAPVRMYPRCCNLFAKSEEFKQLSESAKSAFNAIAPKLEMFDDFIEVAKVEKPDNGFISQGELVVQYNDHDQYITIDVAGLLWDSRNIFYDEDDQFRVSLVVNHNQQSSVEWSVEGFVEVKMVMVSTKTGVQKHPIENKFAFSLSNSNRAGHIRIPADTKLYVEDRWNKINSFISISVTKVSGARRGPTFDFTVTSEFTDAAFIVEGKKINVNKQYLSTIFPRFFRMFYDTNEVELKDVNYKDFIEFIYWKYPSSKRNWRVSTMFSVLHVAQILGVEIDHYVSMKYLKESVSDVSFPYEMIFFFEFDCGSAANIANYYNNESYVGKHAGFIYNVIKHCPLLARMRPERKAKMYEFMMEMTLSERDGGHYTVDEAF